MKKQKVWIVVGRTGKIKRLCDTRKEARREAEDKNYFFMSCIPSASIPPSLRGRRNNVDTKKLTVQQTAKLRGFVSPNFRSILDECSAPPAEVCDYCHKPGLTMADDGKLYHEDCIERLMKSPPPKVVTGGGLKKWAVYTTLR